MNELYEIQQQTLTAAGISAVVQLNPAHQIFTGHFPGQPVLPGVCMMELVRDIAERKQNTPLRISGGPLIKFLHMVDPRQTGDLVVEISMEEKGGRLMAEGKLFKETTVFVKFRLELIAFPGSAAAPREIF